MTVSDLCYLMASRLDEITILELLDISSEELVERFEDVVELRYDYLITELEELGKQYE